MQYVQVLLVDSTAQLAQLCIGLGFSEVGYVGGVKAETHQTKEKSLPSTIHIETAIKCHHGYMQLGIQNFFAGDSSVLVVLYASSV